MRTALAIAALLVSSVPTLAEWRMQTFTDQMTDRRETSATLAAGNSTHAALRVHCMNSSLFPEIVFDEVIGFGRIGANYRFDDGPMEQRIMPISASGRELWLWLGEPAAIAKQIGKSKRLRVQVFPRGGEATFFNFDLAGAEKAIAEISCR
jgi:hypothetical protein